jgi:hypothetical protein
MLEYFILFVHRNDHFMTVGIAARLIVVILLRQRRHRPTLHQIVPSVQSFLRSSFYVATTA